jgi:ABC-2 type transport system ATP-binding protein
MEEVIVSPALFEVRNLHKTYPGGVEAVRGLSFSLKEGICFGILGPNGAGKTTTIEICEGIQAATSGEILFRSKPLGREFKEKSGIQFQNTALQDFLQVGEIIKIFSKFYIKTLPLEEIRKLCHLDDIWKKDHKKLSGGQRQRLLLAVALVNDPDIIFLDEPTTGLDPGARRDFWDLVKTIKSRRKTIVLTTHYMEEAQVLCDELIIVDQGKIIESGSPNELILKHFPDSPQKTLEDVFLKLTGRGLAI